MQAWQEEVERARQGQRDAESKLSSMEASLFYYYFFPPNYVCYCHITLLQYSMVCLMICLLSIIGCNNFRPKCKR